MASISKALKSDVLKQLERDDVEAAKASVSTYPARQVINWLISFYCHKDALVRWRAIEFSGHVVAGHAAEDMESARIIMRRLLWMLNDESGGIGWGVPEAMGEILALSEPLANEYHRVYLSHVQPACNFLEHPVLQRGLLWGVGRLASTRKAIVRPFLPDIVPFLDSEDPYHRAFAARAIAFAGGPSSSALIEKLHGDPAEIEIYEESTLKTKTVAEVSRALISP
ncbi:MAG: DVU0298 family protein [Thermodesulfobacteriota bacterium]